MFSDTDAAEETRRQICSHSTVARARRRVPGKRSSRGGPSPLRQISLQQTRVDVLERAAELDSPFIDVRMAQQRDHQVEGARWLVVSVPRGRTRRRVRAPLAASMRETTRALLRAPEPAPVRRATHAAATNRESPRIRPSPQTPRAQGDTGRTMFQLHGPVRAVSNEPPQVGRAAPVRSRGRHGKDQSPSPHEWCRYPRSGDSGLASGKGSFRVRTLSCRGSSIGSDNRG